MGLLWFLLIGLVAGWLAGLLTRGRGFGCIANVLIGALGGLVGGFLFDLLGVEFGGRLGALLTALVGAMILLVATKLIWKLTR